MFNLHVYKFGGIDYRIVAKEDNNMSEALRKGN